MHRDVVALNSVRVIPGAATRTTTRRLSDPPRRLRLRVTSAMSASKSSAIDLLRGLPLVVGAVGISGVLLNRLVSGIEPALLATSSQSRADVIAIFVSAVLCLTGLQWLSIRPKDPIPLKLEGENALYISDKLRPEVASELDLCWKAIQGATQAKLMVVFWDSECIMHVGKVAPTHTPGSAQTGPLCQEIMSSGSARYFANLSLFPGKAELLKFIPSNTQSLIIQPFGKKGIVIVGAAFQRAFTILDQAWISAWFDKIEVSLAE